MDLLSPVLLANMWYYTPSTMDLVSLLIVNEHAVL